MSITNKAKLAMTMMTMMGGIAFAGHANAACEFHSTKADNHVMKITATEKDGPEVKEFLETCKNPYTKKYAKDPEAAKAGKKIFGLYSCTQCHGGNAGGQTGPSIIDDRWQYSKHVTDKGMFETIAGGSDAGMPTWHQQLQLKDDGSCCQTNPDMPSTDEILKVIGWLRAGYKGGGDTPWLNE
jgi:cytochrome c-L